MYRNQLRKQGFALVDELMPSNLVSKLRDGIQRLSELNLPASFVFLFDEAWLLARIARTLLRESTLETNEFQFDLLAWHVHGLGGGFSPHRDRQPDEVYTSFGKGENSEDAKFVTLWIALSNAQPANSCLYMIPKGCDPGYLMGDNDDDKDPLHVALPNKQAFQRVRAMPREPGQSILFTHRIIHWGSQPDPENTDPRIAISFVCSDPSFEKSYLDLKHFTDSKLPPFHIRLLLVCAQLLIYYQRFELSRQTLRACYLYCKGFETELEKNYRRMVYIEYVKAMNEAREAGEQLEDEEEEEVMEAMLAAKSSGYDGFDDDFEDANDGEVEQVLDDENDDENDREEANLFGGDADKGEVPSKRLKTS